MATEEIADLNADAHMPSDPNARWFAMKAYSQAGLGQKITLGREVRFVLAGAEGGPMRSFAFDANFTLMRIPGASSEETRFRQYEVRAPGNMTVARFRLYPNRLFVYTFAE